MSYCGNCGSPLPPNAKFCGNCGAQQQAPQNQPAYVQPNPAGTAYYSPPPPPPMQTPSSMQPTSSTPMTGAESTVGVVLLKKMKSLGRYDTWAGVVTNQRLIFAQLTSEMLSAAAQQARNQAKAEDKGFWGQWGDQIKGTLGYANRYFSMPPQAILAETPGNFCVDNSMVSEIKVHLTGTGEDEQREFKVDFHSGIGNFEFHMDENSDFTDLLKRVYGERVKMPFGYFSKAIKF
jgi:hypothetical protein